MNDIMRSLYNGKIVPWERRQKPNPELLKTAREADSEQKYFMEKMSLDDCQRFQEFINLQAELLSHEEDGIFAYGFTLGVMLMTDVMNEADAIIEN